jgi:hypothetical protein
MFTKRFTQKNSTSIPSFPFLATSLSQAPTFLSSNNGTEPIEGTIDRPPPYVPRAAMFPLHSPPVIRYSVDMNDGKNNQRDNVR